MILAKFIALIIFGIVGSQNLLSRPDENPVQEKVIKIHIINVTLTIFSKTKSNMIFLFYGQYSTCDGQSKLGRCDLRTIA